jgi:hypothetical protein
MARGVQAPQQENANTPSCFYRKFWLNQKRSEQEQKEQTTPNFGPLEKVSEQSWLLQDHYIGQATLATA